MEVDDEIQTPQQARKFSRVSSNGGRIDSSNISYEPSAAVVNKNQPPNTTSITAITTPTTDVLAVATNRLRQWPHSSRIIRVSRASGGKDRHSKVWTARGPRDRRVRLSVNTAIQFYDLQDRLGYEQPSKAVEWLIKAAEDAINELPALNSCNTFPPETPRQLSDERRADSAEPDPDGDLGLGQSQQQQQISRSGCSSNNSENSKGSGLSLSRSEIRVKARERARERTAKEKERESEPTRVHVSGHTQQQQQQQQNVSTMPQTSSFTQLLTAGISNLNESNTGPASSSPGPSSLSPDVGLFQKQARGNNSTNQWLSASTTAMDYFGSSLMGTSSSRQIQLGNTSHSLPHQVMTISSLGENHHHQQQQHSSHSHGLQHHQQQHFPFVSDLVQVPNTGAVGLGASGNVYNFNFTISSSSTSSGGLGGAGFNRGTLQSNSPPSLLPYLQRYSTTDGSSVPFFLGSAPAAPAEEGQHHHHQFQPPGLQLCHGDGSRHQSDQKGKSKN